MVDGTPDVNHTEQTTFVLRYLANEMGEFVIKERFFNFVDCCEKTAAEIATLIVSTLKEFEIPLSDCRGQSYDIAADMSGKYNPKAHFRSQFSVPVLSMQLSFSELVWGRLGSQLFSCHNFLWNGWNDL